MLSRAAMVLYFVLIGCGLVWALTTSRAPGPDAPTLPIDHGRAR